MTPPGQALDTIKGAVVAQAAQTETQRKDALALFMDRQASAIAAALPRHLTPDRMLRVALTCIRTTPKLAKVAAENPASLAAAVVTLAQCGLEPGGPLGESWILPYDNKRTGKTEAQVIIGYKGILKLTRQSGQVKNVSAHEVRQADVFEFSYGLNPTLKHIPAREDRGPSYAWYAVAEFTNGGNAFVVLFREDVERHRAKSQGGGKGDRSPWVTHYDSMARKSAIKELAPYLPLSPELSRQIEVDDKVIGANSEIRADMADDPGIYEAELVDDEEEPQPPEGVDASTGEVTTPPIADALPPASDTVTPSGEPGVTLSPSQRAAQRRDIMKKAQQYNVSDAQLLALVRYATNGAKDLLADLETGNDFYVVLSAVDHFGQGHIVLGEDGRFTVVKQ